MRREIERTAICFGLDDAAGGLALGSAMHQDFPDALPRYHEAWLRVKLTRQFIAILRCELDHASQFNVPCPRVEGSRDFVACVSETDGLEMLEWRSEWKSIESCHVNNGSRRARIFWARKKNSPGCAIK